MTLEDVDPSMFGAVVNWLYTQKIEEMQQDDDGHSYCYQRRSIGVVGEVVDAGPGSYLAYPFFLFECRLFKIRDL